MKNKKLKKKIIRDFKAGKYREVKGKEKYHEIASHTKDSWLEDEKMYLENEFEEEKSLAARNDRLKKRSYQQASHWTRIKS
jgi:hypothetical protein